MLRIPTGHETLVTTDFSLEGIHFRREWDTPERIGHRCLTRGLSDIAAMGGEPVAVFLSLALPLKLPQGWVDGFARGVLKLARRFHVTLAGGDTASSPDGVLADIIVVGSVPKGQAILRSGARPGDRIYVTGLLGGAAQRIFELYSTSGKRRRAAHTPTPLPMPRIEIGRLLRERGLASAMIDISDGLSTDLSHICEASGLGADVWENAVPRAKLRSNQLADVRIALHGGDDYELLFTSPRKSRVPDRVGRVPITQVGEITPTGKVTLVDNNGARSKFAAHGWEHFSHDFSYRSRL
jgi:thiamine-monophosphate kinase